MKPEVTIIIAAYGLAGNLPVTLESIYRQTYPFWRVLLIADCCDDAFFSAIGELDKRVNVVNLPLNCGHQYGPNSVGIRLAETEYLAFMNHDDLWLADHLELAMLRLEQYKHDAYFGKASFCHALNQPGWPEGSEPLRFSEFNRPYYYWRALFGPFYFFEPASAWVIRTSYAKQVGDWLPPTLTDISPVMDWFARLFCVTRKVIFGDVVSILKMNVHNYAKTCEHLPLYFRETVGREKLHALVDTDIDVLRESITEQIDNARELGLLVRKEMTSDLAIDSLELKRIDAFERFVTTGYYNRNEIGDTVGPYTTAKAVLTHCKRTGNSNPLFPTVEYVFSLYLESLKT